jgi:hypothetical protein
MAKHKYKICSCKEEFSEVRVCCTGCGKSGLTVKESDAVLTNLHEAHKTFAEVDGSFRPVTKDGKPITGKAGKEIVERYNRLGSCYEALGLTRQEALIAATVECRLVDINIDMAKFEF